MMKKMLQSFALAIQNIRSNLFHTVLSVLGIVIGVAALVAMLSFIDGLEKYAKDQLSQTTSLNAIIITPKTYQELGSVRVKKDSFASLTPAAFDRLLGGVPGISTSLLTTNIPEAVAVDSSRSPLGAMMQAVSNKAWKDSSRLLAGRVLAIDAMCQPALAYVNQAFAKQVLGHDRYAEVLNKAIRTKKHTLTVAGVIKNSGPDEPPSLIFPIALLSGAELKKYPPTAVLEVAEVEKVTGVKQQLQEKIKQQFPGHDADFEVLTNDLRLKQVEQGFLLFRIIMGLIVGISIVVGGVGVMNVLLISVKERTAEIGIRKAVGARRRDILHLFLAESITVSAFGSMLGLVVGVLATLVIVPVIKALTQLPFEAAYTWNTFFTISVIAVLTGVIFGTYPAMKASGLDPVEAIRRD